MKHLFSQECESVCLCAGHCRWQWYVQCSHCLEKDCCFEWVSVYCMINMGLAQTILFFFFFIDKRCVFCLCLLFSAKDPTGWNLFDSCLQLLKSRMESRELDKEVCDIWRGVLCHDNRGPNFRWVKPLRDGRLFYDKQEWECKKIYKNVTVCVMKLKNDRVDCINWLLALFVFIPLSSSICFLS